MTNYNSQVDEYITKSADFAKPILEHWRKLVHKACPEVVETIKWGYPHFDYKNDFMGVIAARKDYCTFTFVKSELMKDERLKDSKNQKPEARFLGRISKMSDLPSDKEFIFFIKEAMLLNDKGEKVAKPKSDKPKVLETPDYLAKRLEASPEAKVVFDSKSDSFRKEYISWIADAKTEATREKRMDEAIEWISEGKSRYWKYAK